MQRMEDSASLVTHALRTQLPVTRVRKIIRLDPDCTAISAEAAQLVTLATEFQERFIGLLAKVAYSQAVFDKRKTLQLRDLEFCVKNYEPFSFLDGTLDGWPESSRGKRSLVNRSSTAIAAEISEGFFSPDADEEQEDLNVDGLNDEIFGFDESLEGIGPPLDDQITEKLDDSVIAKSTEMVEDSVPENQSLNLEIFGHYGYHCPMNSTFAVPIQTPDVEEGDNDMTRGKKQEEEMEIDILEYDSLIMTASELAMDNVEISPNI